MEKAANSPIGKFLKPKIEEVAVNYPKLTNFQQIRDNLLNYKYETICSWNSDVRKYFSFCVKLFGPDTEIGLCFKTMLQIIEESLSEVGLILPNKKIDEDEIESLHNHFQGATANAPNNRKQFIAGSDVPLPTVRPKAMTNEEPEPYIDPYQIELLHNNISQIDEKSSRHFMAMLRCFEKCGTEKDGVLSYDLGLVSSYSLDLIRQIIVSKNKKEKRQEKLK